MPSRVTPSWYRKAVVAASVALVGVVAGLAFVVIRQEGLAGSLPAEANAATAAGAGLLLTDGGGSGLRLCNKTASRVGVAVGYKDSRQWTTEGWWNVSPGGCETLMAGPLVSRFYYIYALDYDQGGIWSGKAVMCTRDKMFTIHGIEDCVARGYERTGFFEVDTGEQKSWTVQLAEPSATGTGGR